MKIIFSRGVIKSIAVAFGVAIGLANCHNRSVYFVNSHYNRFNFTVIRRLFEFDAQFLKKKF